MAYNIMTCEGWLGEVGLVTGCSMAWLGAAILFFIIIFARKGMEIAGMEFNSLGGFVGGYLTYFILIALTGASKWGLLGGIVGMIAGGIAFGYFYGGESGGY